MKYNFIDLFKTEDLREWWNSQIPSQRDLDLSDFVQDWIDLGLQEREIVSDKITSTTYLIPLIYSDRMASLAVRNKDIAPINSALAALALDRWRFDWRDNVTRIAVCYSALLQIGHDPDLAFEKMAAQLTGKPAEGLRSFARRSSENKSLKVFHYELKAASDGLRYLHVVSK
jgi:hypothetical protein